MKDSSANGVVNRNEFGAVGKCCFHLNCVDHSRNAFHDLIMVKYFGAFRSQLGNRFASARPLQDEVCYQCDAFGIVELDAPREPPPSDERRERDHKLVSFTRGEVHEDPPSMAGFSMMTTSSARGRGLIRALR